MKKLSVALCGVALLMSVPLLAFSQDIQAGKKVFKDNDCASCHGDDAKSSTSPEYPILAGQHRDYLIHALKSYQRGKAGAPASSNIRDNAIMGGMAESLSAEDIRNVAAWLASLESPLGVRR